MPVIFARNIHRGIHEAHNKRPERLREDKVCLSLEVRSGTASDSVRLAEQSDASKDTSLPLPPPPPSFESRLLYCLFLQPLNFGRLDYEKDAAIEQARGRVVRTVGQRLSGYFVVPAIRGYTVCMLPIKGHDADDGCSS